MVFKKLLLTSLVLLIAFTSFGQATLSITSPSITAPYQVAAGTAVTFEWDYYSMAPTGIYTYDQLPNTTGFGIDPLWTAHTNYTQNLDGTYSITINITEDTWILGAYDAGWTGWSYSNIIEMTTVSSYVITADDSYICSSNDSVKFIAPDSIGFTHQWYMDGTSISGAIDTIYYATAAGTYSCEITSGTTVSPTNTITISNYEISYTGVLGTNQVVLTADQTFSSYQWYEGTASGSLTQISGATNSSYTAPITSSLKYYMLEGVTPGGCSVLSVERPLVDSLFATPVVTLYAQQNSFGKVCEGVDVSFAVNDKINDVLWYKDGVSTGTTSDSVNIWGAYQNGTYYAEVTILDWPEINIISNSVVVNISSLITPDVTGANYWDYFCPGDIIPMILTDEGYSYTWYLHDTNNVYNSSNIITVPASGVYQHTFTNATYVTIEASFDGCTKTTTKTLKSYADKQFSISVSNYEQEYLCTDSAAHIYVNDYDTANFSNYQWHKFDNGSWTALNGETNTEYNAISDGEYIVTAAPDACPSVTDTSYTKKIYSYLESQPYIYADNNSICEGDTTILHLSASSNWYALQWQEGSVAMGTSGAYELTFSGMINNSATDTQVVNSYNSYVVSAKSTSCPNGLKVKSIIQVIKPTLNPEITFIRPLLEKTKQIIKWDSTLHYIGCDNDSAHITLVDTDYASIKWYSDSYAGGYELGSLVSSSAEATIRLDAIWATAVVTNTDGCVGQSTPVLLDSYVFADPAVTSYNNGELCGVGDSTLVHLSFAGDWDRFEWANSGTVIANSDNDSLYAKTPGEYVIDAYPRLCPDVRYTSGTGAMVNYLYAEIWENDTLLYAMPEEGFYTYQWFFNGDSIDAPDENLTWIFPKDQLQDGVYTVAVSNENCTETSSSYLWTGINKAVIKSNLKVYPNPVDDKLYIEFEDNSKSVTDLTITDMNGRIVYQTSSLSSNFVSTEQLATGMYIIKIITEDGLIHIAKLSKN